MTAAVEKKEKRKREEIEAASQGFSVWLCAGGGGRELVALEK